MKYSSLPYRRRGEGARKTHGDCVPESSLSGRSQSGFKGARHDLRPSSIFPTALYRLANTLMVNRKPVHRLTLVRIFGHKQLAFNLPCLVQGVCAAARPPTSNPGEEPAYPGRRASKKEKRIAACANESRNPRSRSIRRRGGRRGLRRCQTANHSRSCLCPDVAQAPRARQPQAFPLTVAGLLARSLNSGQGRWL